MTRTKIRAPRVGYFYTANTELVVVECPGCGILYAIPAELERHARKYNRAEHPHNFVSITCPAGHEWHKTGRNEEQELRRKLEIQRDRAGRLAHERDQERARRIAQKGATTRAKKRHAAGVCPACKRTFQNVQRHMAGQHPDYDPAAKA